ncbi:MAG: response regulator [Clostridiales bacterium]|nr:response regulator [Clostridiales bacterium]
MRILAVDDESLSLKNLEKCITAVCEDAEVDAFDNPSAALSAALANKYDAIFMDINMGGRSKGIEIARKIREECPSANIIFCTGYSEFTGDAMALHASGYIMKPVTPEKVRKELEDLRYSKGGKVKLRVQTFGNFEVFYNNAPLSFSYSKSKELLAFLIDRRGAMVSNNEIYEALWEASEGSKDSYLRNIRLDLTKTLAGLGLEDVVIRQKGFTGINPDLIDCDLYKLLDNIKNSSGTVDQAGYFGEYMMQYPWANYTNNYLRNKLHT